MQTLLSQSSLFPERACSIQSEEDLFSIRKNGYSYDFVIRDKIAVEHVHKILSQALAFQIQSNGVFPAAVPTRGIRDHIVKTLSVV